jgi:four helix bundle protein
VKPLFDHEKLQCHQEALKWVGLAEGILQRVPRSLSAWDQLDRASTSIPLNIAEGNGKFTSPDRGRSFDDARGSALECAACLEVLVAKGRLAAGEDLPRKELLQRVVSMPVGLIRGNSATRLQEDPAPYRVEEWE